ncbi:succinate dehydrogenase cytochrome b subunit [Chryseobacterium sp. C-71]|jgi:succinate dehydrogenase / fumarate reductase cytochrome b subunit|uniref:succinate dehydrogenase cytochrome b subunit n=1 Tax=Chryseobacterium sp. C-71 TaxID=2893882 RepID=UPI001E54AB84|nr:succinate dehydrogenase cytochrome b subunit [Chryseobacterium sp. C-71]UFH33743.1 succinate dehydrogenase cytochrome b subunit [Chryseobacterium sp. C-71]
MAGLTSSTIGRKYAMALSAMFLLSFLVIHVSSNITSIFSVDVYNEVAHFMGYNPLVQYALQPVLTVGILFHFIMGFILEIKNNKARPIKYANNNGSANSTWVSRNMIISGAVILAFFALHFYDFWFPELDYKFVQGNTPDETRYWGELHHKFHDIWRVVLYVISFVLLGLHLAHGFQSSFQSVGARHPKYTPVIKAVGFWFSVIVPLGFIVIAVFHYVTQ